MENTVTRFPNGVVNRSETDILSAFLQNVPVLMKARALLVRSLEFLHQKE